MKNYKSYVLEAHRLCEKALEGNPDSARINEELTRMQEKVRQSRLTVYQKDFLIQQLRATSTATQSQKRSEWQRISSSSTSSSAPFPLLTWEQSQPSAS